jgi:hypothetical protein
MKEIGFAKFSGVDACLKWLDDSYIKQPLSDKYFSRVSRIRICEKFTKSVTPVTQGGAWTFWGNGFPKLPVPEASLSHGIYLGINI